MPIADFLVDDACHLCGRRHAGDVETNDPYQRALLRPVTVVLAWRLAVTNHPVCLSCVARLERSRWPGTLGWFLPSGGLLTPSGVVLAPPPTVGPPPPPGIVSAIAPFRTNPTLLHLIRCIKFSRVWSLAPGIGEALAVTLTSVVREMGGAPVIVPVPMDARSLRHRGFNQSQRIAEAVAGHLGLTIIDDALIKPAHTRPQSLAARGDRLVNARDGFAPGPGGVGGRHVLLVDDLVTTGATAAVSAAILGAKGAASVTVACVGLAL
jgi:predicted amidophosphoribosyltransferase